MATNKLLFVADNDWFFISHRLPLAIAAMHAGYEVWVIARNTGRAAEIRSAGIHFIHADLIRKGINPLRELQICFQLYRIYRKVRPHIIHHISLKIILVGALASHFAGIRNTVNAVTGLGHFFINPRKAWMVNCVFSPVLKWYSKKPGTQFIFQNPEDRHLFLKNGWASAGRSTVIKGSGIDLQQFKFRQEPPSPPIVISCATRLLKEKGILEFAQAARRLKIIYGDAVHFILAGRIIVENPSGITEQEIQEWVDEGILSFQGFQEDMFTLLTNSHINVLPSYREGLPRSLIEASAVGRPMVSCDVPGCREIVVDGLNGILVPAGDAEELAKAIERLIGDKELRTRMGKAAREKAEREFGIEAVLRGTLGVYAFFLPRQSPVGATSVRVGWRPTLNKYPDRNQ